LSANFSKGETYSSTEYLNKINSSFEKSPVTELFSIVDNGYEDSAFKQYLEMDTSQIATAYGSDSLTLNNIPKDTFRTDYDVTSHTFDASNNKLEMLYIYVAEQMTIVKSDINDNSLNTFTLDSGNYFSHDLIHVLETDLSINITNVSILANPDRVVIADESLLCEF